MSCGRPLSVGIGDRFGRARQNLDAIRLDQRIQHERASRLPLAVVAVAAMHEHRRAREPVADSAAGAAAGRVAQPFRSPALSCVWRRSVYFAAMTQANFDDVIFSATLRPHRSLGRRGIRRPDRRHRRCFVLRPERSSGRSAHGRSSVSSGSTCWRSCIAFRLNYRAARSYEEVEVSRIAIVIRKVDAIRPAAGNPLQPAMGPPRGGGDRGRGRNPDRSTLAGPPRSGRRVPQSAGPQELCARLRRRAGDGARMKPARKKRVAKLRARCLDRMRKDHTMAFETQMVAERPIAAAPRNAGRLRRREGRDRIRHRELARPAFARDDRRARPHGADAAAKALHALGRAFAESLSAGDHARPRPRAPRAIRDRARHHLRGRPLRPRAGCTISSSRTRR